MNRRLANRPYLNPLRRNCVTEKTKICDETRLLSRLWAMFLLLLITVTFPLWFAPPEMPGMPAVSVGLHFFPWLPETLPKYSYVVPSIALVVCLLLIVAAPQKYRSAWWLVGACLLVSFMLDQHRLQPWAYQSAIYALVFAAIDPHQARRYLIPLAASVYIYSAAGKFDFQFAHTVGQNFLDAATRPIGGLPDRWDESARAKLALIFPAMELICGAGLLIRPTRIVAAVVVIMMHATLIMVLGPWALDHSSGVLMWNLLLIVQAYLLMIKPEWSAGSSAQDRDRMNYQSLGSHRVESWIVFAVVLGVLVAPLTERIGYWDHWTSWSLYSPHTSRVDIELHRSAMEALPPSLRTFVEADDNDDGWRKLAIERWSLSSRGVPIYPQARYQLALAEQLARQLRLTDEIRVRVRGVSDRWTGHRDEQLLLGHDEIRAAMKSYWLSHPAPR